MIINREFWRCNRVANGLQVVEYGLIMVANGVAIG